MSQLVTLFLYLQKMMKIRQPRCIRVIEDGNCCVSSLLQSIIGYEQYECALITRKWEEVSGACCDICIIAFPNRKTSLVKERINLELSQDGQETILITSYIDQQEGYRKFNPILFCGYHMKMHDFKLRETNLQVYIFYPADGKKNLEQRAKRNEKEVINAENKIKIPLKQKMHIVYYLPHGSLTGGLKSLLEQARQLMKLGHEVSIIRKIRPGEKVLPIWYNLSEKDGLKGVYGLGDDEDVKNIIPQDTDLVVTGWLYQLCELVGYKGKAMLWEQGAEWLFGDFGEKGLFEDHGRRYMKQIYELPFYICSVSKVIEKIMKERYGRSSRLIPCGIDTRFYHPLEKKYVADVPTVLMVGSPYLNFKRMHVGITFLNKVYEHEIDFKLQWISQVPVNDFETPFPKEIIVCPSQEDLAKLYQKADLLLMNSVYESFALPPLEAMASGIAVVAADCGGIMTYAKDEYNALICKQEDEQGFVAAISRLLEDPMLRKRLGRNGRQTALKYDYSLIAKQAEAVFRELIEE